jgi:hypothetical protein
MRDIVGINGWADGEENNSSFGVKKISGEKSIAHGGLVNDEAHFGIG